MKRRAARPPRAGSGLAQAARLSPFVLLVGWAVVAGCTKDKALAAAGQDCDLATDCLPGLVCIEDAQTGRRVCSSDLTNVQGELPPDGGGGNATPTEAGAREGGTKPPPPDGGGSPPPQDSGSTPPPKDAAGD